MKIPKLSLSQNIAYCLLASCIQLYILHLATIVYVPLLFTLLFSFSYGFLEPKRGWILSIIQIVFLIAGYLILNLLGIKGTSPQITEFATYVAIFPSFVAAFMGSFILRL